MTTNFFDSQIVTKVLKACHDLWMIPQKWGTRSSALLRVSQLLFERPHPTPLGTLLHWLLEN